MPFSAPHQEDAAVQGDHPPPARTARAWYARPVGAVLASLLAVTFFIVLLGAIYLPAEVGRLTKPGQLTITHHLPARGGCPAVSLFWHQPRHKPTGHRQHLAVHAVAGSQPGLLFPWPELDPYCLARGAQSHEVLAGNWDGAVYVLDLRQPPQRPVLLGRHATGPVHDVAGSVDGRWAVSFDLRQLCVWNVASGGLQWQRDDANCFTLDPQSPRVLSATTAGELIDLDLETGGATALPGPAFAHIRGLAISPDGQLLAVVHDLSGVAVLNRQTAEMLWQVESGMYAGAPNLVFSPSGRLLVSLAQDDLRPLAVWDARTGGRPGHLSGHSICVLGAAFGPDGALYSWGPDGMIRTWDPHTCTPLAVTPLTPPPHAR